MFKNGTSQKFVVFAFDSTTNTPKTGDAANITAYVSKDFGSVTVLADTSATEMDATNAKGYYLFDAAQTETNADVLVVSAKSSTANIVVVGAPATIFTFPTTGILAPTTAGRTLVVDASGLADANTVKVGPTGSGTAQTARDLGASVLLSSGTGTGQLDFTSGVVKSNLTQVNADATAAANVAKTTRAIGRGTVTSSASTTSIPTSAFTPNGNAADQFKGRIITFDADTTTAALRGQSTDITASTNATNPTFTVTALTTAPASGDSFSVT